MDLSIFFIVNKTNCGAIYHAVQHTTECIPHGSLTETSQTKPKRSGSVVVSDSPSCTGRVLQISNASGCSNSYQRR